MSIKNLTEFKDRLKFARERAGLSRDALGKRLDISGAYIGQLESGKKENPSEIFLSSLCMELDINSVWLKTGEGNIERKLDSVFEPISEYKIQGDRELAEIVDILVNDLPEAKSLVLKLLRGRKESKEALEAFTEPLKEGL